MHWINLNEKEMIKTWAREECSEEVLISEYLPMPDANQKSYWCKYGTGEEIKDYCFDTLPELRTLLERELKEEFYIDLYLPLSVAAFKEKEIIKKEKDFKDSKISYSKNDEFFIPDFVYKF